MENSMCLRNHSHRVFSFSAMCKLAFSAFQRNAQPSPLGTISGVWGYATNKHFCCFGNCDETVKISKLVQVCIACQFELSLIIIKNSENVHPQHIVFFEQTKYNILMLEVRYGLYDIETGK